MNRIVGETALRCLLLRDRRDTPSFRLKRLWPSPKYALLHLFSFLFCRREYYTPMARENVTRQGKLSTYIGLILNADLIILSLLLFCVCAGHFFVYYERTAYLRVFGRPYVFLHLLVSIFSLYPIIKYHVLMLVHILCVECGCECKEKNKKDTSKDDDVIVLELQDMSNSSASCKSSQSEEMNQEKSSSIDKNCPLLLYMYKLFLEFYVVDGKYYIHQLYLCKFLQ